MLEGRLLTVLLLLPDKQSSSASLETLLALLQAEGAKIEEDTEVRRARAPGPSPHPGVSTAPPGPGRGTSGVPLHVSRGLAAGAWSSGRVHAALQMGAGAELPSALGQLVQQRPWGTASRVLEA